MHKLHILALLSLTAVFENCPSAAEKPITIDDFGTFKYPNIQHLIERGSLEAAETACTILLNQNPEDKEARLLRSDVYQLRNDLTKAQADLNYLITHFPKYAPGYSGMALTFLKIPELPKTGKMHPLKEWLFSDDPLKKDAALSALEYAVKTLQDIRKSMRY